MKRTSLGIVLALIACAFSVQTRAALPTPTAEMYSFRSFDTIVVPRPLWPPATQVDRGITEEVTIDAESGIASIKKETLLDLYASSISCDMITASATWDFVAPSTFNATDYAWTVWKSSKGTNCYEETGVQNIAFDPPSVEFEESSYKVKLDGNTALFDAGDVETYMLPGECSQAEDQFRIRTREAHTVPAIRMTGGDKHSLYGVNGTITFQRLDRCPGSTLTGSSIPLVGQRRLLKFFNPMAPRVENKWGALFQNLGGFVWEMTDLWRQAWGLETLPDISGTNFFPNVFVDGSPVRPDGKFLVFLPGDSVTPVVVDILAPPNTQISCKYTLTFNGQNPVVDTGVKLGSNGALFDPTIGTTNGVRNFAAIKAQNVTVTNTVTAKDIRSGGNGGRIWAIDDGQGAGIRILANNDSTGYAGMGFMNNAGTVLKGQWYWQASDNSYHFWFAGADRWKVDSSGVFQVPGVLHTPSIIKFGLTSGDAALKQSGVFVASRKGDDSGYAPLRSSYILVDGQLFGGVLQVGTSTGGTRTMNSTSEGVSFITTSAATLTLPTASGVIGMQKTVKVVSPATSGTVATTSSQTIDGATTYALGAVNKYVTVVSDGSNWKIIGNN